MEEKRKQRAYKMKDKPYSKAMRRAKREKGSLATMIEYWVTMYAAGFKIDATEKEKLIEKLKQVNTYE